MSKRQHGPDGSAAAVDLIKRLKSTGNDVSAHPAIVESRDGASTAAALPMSLAGAKSASTNESKLKVLPKETLMEILANLNRRDFDAVELVNRALGALITAKFSDAPRRVISLMFYEKGT